MPRQNGQPRPTRSSGGSAPKRQKIEEDEKDEEFEETMRRSKRSTSTSTPPSSKLVSQPQPTTTQQPRNRKRPEAGGSSPNPLVIKIKTNKVPMKANESKAVGAASSLTSSQIIDPYLDDAEEVIPKSRSTRYCSKLFLELSFFFLIFNSPNFSSRQRRGNTLSQSSLNDDEDSDQGHFTYTGFWKNMADYAAPLTKADVDFFNVDKSGLPSDSPFLQIPPLGTHYKEIWQQEDQAEFQGQQQH